MNQVSKLIAATDKRPHIIRLMVEGKAYKDIPVPPGVVSHRMITGDRQPDGEHTLYFGIELNKPGISEAPCSSLEEAERMAGLLTPDSSLWVKIV